MEMSSKMRYALLALLVLARYYEQGKVLQIEQIASLQQIPDRYLGQLLMMLRRYGLVRSQRGAKGGYLLNKAPQEITLLQILACMEGSKSQEECNYSESLNMEDTIIQEIWQEATIAAMAVFGDYTLQDLCDKQQQRQVLDPMYHI